MDFNEVKPGDVVSVAGTTGQVVWKSDFHILQFGWLCHRQELCLFDPTRGKYVTLVIMDDKTAYKKTYFYQDEGL